MHNKFTISSLIKIGSEKLQNAGINNYKNESQWLLLDILKKNSTWIYSNQDHTVSLKTSNIYSIHLILYLQPTYNIQYQQDGLDLNHFFNDKIINLKCPAKKYMILVFLLLF